MSENIVSRDEAEKIIKEAVDDYIDIETLQSLLDMIHGSGEFLVVESMTDIDTDEEE